MKIRKIGVIALLVFSSFAANNVAPSKSELEAMYDKAFREFDTNNFSEALIDLDAIDARQPDLAESQNLRGVILMRQGIYDKAETALMEALRIDPKFWNARFNLAEVPFLKKDWAEARKRFQDLLSSNATELQGDASQLIQYKILLTYLLEGKENMVDSILAKFELSPDTPAVHYANAAIALQRKNAKEAKDWMAAAEKNFSPQLNKLFVESLYEVGWLEKPAGQTRAALELTTAAERSAKTKAFARSRFEEAQKAFQQRDLASARKFVDEADAADPNQPAMLNLRGEILMEQQEFDQAEAAFKAAAKADPKFREAQYNLAQIPFKKKDYAQARSRFETLFSQTPGGDKNQASQLIKFKIYMTFLLEGKESRAQKMMEQFQFTGDTPALYYAQAAWEFKHNNPNKGTDWITSAKKIYSPALNVIFIDSFYDLGWQASPVTAAAPATEAAAVMSSAQTESGPAIEPSPIPAVALAKTKPAKESTSESLASTLPAMSGMEAMTNQSTAAGTPARPEDVPAIPAPALSPTVETSVAAAPASSAIASFEKPAVAEPVNAAASATPATVLAPAHVREWSQPTFGERLDRLADPQTLLVGALLLAGIVLLMWVVVPEVRRRAAQFAPFRRVAPASGPRMDEIEPTSSDKPLTLSNRLTGGPRQVSLKLKASEPSLRPTVLPVGKPRVFGETASAANLVTAEEEPEVVLAPVQETGSESVGPIVEQTPLPVMAEMPVMTEMPVVQEATEWASPPPPAPLDDIVEPVFAQSTAIAEPEIEPIGQGQPIPYQTPISPEPVIEVTRPEPPPQPMFVPEVATRATGTFRQPVSQTTTIATMPEPIQIPTAPLIRTPAAGGIPQPAGAMQTAVQLSFSFEIASMQLTPAFKMGALQLRPTSKIVTMRLAPSQQPQPAMNLQVNFEIAKIQPSGGGLGSIRLTPSQQQRPAAVGSPSFNVAGLQLVSNFEAAPLQITPTQSGQASVLVTGAFQIATVEFSPSFEIASIILNSSSKNISVQLPGGIAEGGAPMFEIANLQIAGTGDIGMMQVHAVGQKRA